MTFTEINYVKDLERAERRSQDFRFSYALRAQAAQRADRIRRQIERSAPECDFGRDAENLEDFS